MVVTESPPKNTCKCYAWSSCAARSSVVRETKVIGNPECIGTTCGQILSMLVSLEHTHRAYLCPQDKLTSMVRLSFLLLLATVVFGVSA